MSSAQGEDRSDYQGVLPPVDRNGKPLDFVIYKATEGTSWVSQTFRMNVAIAKQHGVPFGSYHFLHPSLDVAQQVELFMSTVAEAGALEAGVMLACDSEISSGTGGRLQLASDRSHLLVRNPVTGEANIRDGVSYPHHLLNRSIPANLGATQVNAATRDFIAGVRTAVEVALGGDYCQELVYTFYDMLPQLSDCTQYPLWLADYASAAPAYVLPWKEWTIWQYAGGGGNGGSDQNGFNGSADAFRSWVNAKRPVPQPPATTTVNTFSVTLPSLSRGGQNPLWITYRAQALVAMLGKYNKLPNTQIVDDGNFGPATEAAVKQIQVSARIAKDLASASGRIGEAEWKFLLTGEFGNA